MSEDTDFFGDVFENPDNDPLLEDEDASPGASADEASDQGVPSWMSENQNSEEASNSDPENEKEPTRKEILLDQRGDTTEGLQQLNNAIGEGWKLVRISLTQPDGDQAPTRTDAHRFVATLEQDNPRSLFDFGQV